MKLLNEKVISEMSNEEILKEYARVCEGSRVVFGIHPLSFDYSDIKNDLHEEILRRMQY